MPNPETAYREATENRYEVHVWIDGDETQVPFTINAGPDYATGDDLVPVLRDLADKLLLGEYQNSHVEMIELTIRDDDSGEDLAAGVAYRW